jgi:hypothetical protein
MLRIYILPVLGSRKLSAVQRRDIQDFADELRAQGLSPSTINNIVDPLRVIFRRAIRRDEIAIDPTNDLDMPAIRGRRDRIEPPEKAHELLAARPPAKRRLGDGPVLWPATRRAARPAVAARRLRRRRHPGRAFVGSGQGPGRRQVRRRAPCRPDGVRRPSRS